ncbi:hypothetical protein HAX54_051468 [Datura stramonium]|uniref:Uncharacterized protein n=1 Tax=Datura stramonium TaxID=4076 RepID=A0ABS8SYI6_DATST|nr:hypothetical protein [Datura stramonium]
MGVVSHHAKGLLMRVRGNNPVDVRDGTCHAGQSGCSGSCHAMPVPHSVHLRLQAMLHDRQCGTERIPNRHDESATADSVRYSGLPGTNHNSNFKRTPKILSECRGCISNMSSKWKKHFELNGIDENTIGALLDKMNTKINT